MAEVELPNTEELEEIRAKKFTRSVALTTAVFAVMLAITSLGGNNAMKEMLLAQQQASDQWAFYQSKAMREHLYKTQKMMLETAVFERGNTMKPEVRGHFEEKIKTLASEEGRYKTEKKKIEDDAKALEATRDKNQTKDPYFDYAEVMLQISIVMASIAILSSSRTVFLFAIAAATLGSLLSANGFLLLVKVPFFH